MSKISTVNQRKGYTMTLTIQAFGSNLWPEHIFVRSDLTSESFCECDFNEMSPVRAVNISWEHHLCLNCNKKITYERNNSYNQFFGFSGWDDTDE